MTARHPELEAQIIAAPDEPGPYLVYADWLGERGEPRGALIAAQAAGAAAASDQLLVAHPELAGPTQPSATPTASLDWDHGFWRALSLGAPGAARPVDAAQVACYLAHPSARFLRELRLDGELDGSVLGALAPVAPTLEVFELYARRTPLAGDDLRGLAACTRLRGLLLFSCGRVPNAALAALSPLRELTSLQLRHLALDDTGAAWLAGLPLRRLELDVASGALTSRGVAALAAMPLATLALGADIYAEPVISVDDAALAPLAGHATLAHLELHDAAITARTAAWLAGLPALATLDVYGSSLDDAAAHALAAARRLRALDLTGTAVTAAGVRSLAQLPAIEQLFLGFLGLDDATVGALAGLTTLRELGLGNSRAITDAAAPALCALTRLERLDLAGTDITPAAIDQLASLPALVELGLEDCTPEVIERARDWPHWYVEYRNPLYMR